MNLHEEQPGVYYAQGDSLAFGASEIEVVKRRSLEVPRRRARICAHPSPDALLHEMLIALRPGGYVRPHRHRDKSETFHVVDGEAELVLFDDDGTVEQRIALGLGPRQVRIHRLNAPRFHTVRVTTECFVVHEIALGPFRPESTELAPWAPHETDLEGIATFLARTGLNEPRSSS
jgi:cupin fold WbuC family metalloprotein